MTAGASCVGLLLLPPDRAAFSCMRVVMPVIVGCVCVCPVGSVRRLGSILLCSPVCVLRCVHVADQSVGRMRVCPSCCAAPPPTTNHHHHHQPPPPPAKGRTNLELREQFILAEGVSQSMTPSSPRPSRGRDPSPRCVHVFHGVGRRRPARARAPRWWTLQPPLSGQQPHGSSSSTLSLPPGAAVHRCRLCLSLSVFLSIGADR
uniref:Putative secreted protein n=1 Tax=Amblyomma triste TaxID=251400 RepID=A0A023G348_AMBTT